VTERERHTNPETVNTELTIIKTSIKIQENKGKFSAMSMVIEYEGLPHIAIAQKLRYSSWLIHAPTPPHVFGTLVGTEDIDVTTTKKMLEMFGAEVTTDDPDELRKLLKQESSQRDADYKKIHAEYLSNPQEKEAYGNSVRTFTENLKAHWEKKKSVQ